jgi:hypothetical protein
MAQPTGTCNGQPCWTASDRAQAQAEWVDAQAEKVAAQENLNAKTSAESAAYYVVMMSNMNACP